MSEPRRLLDEGGDGLGLDLLRSARDDAPLPGARRKTLVALGLGVGLGATVTTGTAASTALIKWIGLGIAGGLLTLGVAEIAGTGAPPAAPAIALTGQASEAARRKATVVSAADQRDQDERAAAPDQAPEPAKPEASAGPKPTAAPSAKPTLADEVALLDSARRSIGSGDVRGGLAALDRYDREVRGGLMSQEATVLRIEAMTRSGDRAGAARIGNAFLEAHPRSVHANRVRSLLGDAARPVDP